MQRIWNIAQPNHKLQKALCQELGISPILANLLINRMIKNVEEAERFLNPTLASLFDPYQLPDMPKAVERLKRAIAKKEKILIFGDYDVDGLTAVALLESQFLKLGLKALHYIPHRVKEGYGLNKEAIDFASQHNVKLLLTVDCGISNTEEIEELCRRHIDVIVTDHHEARDERIPACTAVIDPKRYDSVYPYRDLAGVGVAYKLAQCITQETLEDELDLVLLGTVADMVPLTGENRILVKKGLECFYRTKKVGLQALIEESGLKSISTTSISYILAPRINASGRVDSAHYSLELLLTHSESRARDLAKLLSRHNQERQRLERKILEEAQDLIGREVNFKEHNVIVLAKEGWHQGVLGIVASKIMDRFYRPTIVISLSDGLCRGSCRSIKNFHIFDALWDARDLLENFGGHQHAAGLSIHRDKVPEFKHRINHLAKKRMRIEDLLPSLEIDMELSLADLNEKLIRDIKALEPFGYGNPAVIFYTPALRLKGSPKILSKDTLRFWCTDAEFTYPAVGFGMSSLYNSLTEAKAFDLIYTPTLDDWQPQTIQLEIKDIRFLKS
ncbi:MAG: single-stranded-DNA-specific exonuclease RecJ [Candidatus Omnitrophica bacterium]|nr:single-stranded-DNA-specific exonuclease RecJ [Candidatus Omnitrophota bacterium]